MPDQPPQPQIASMAILIRDDGHVLMLRQPVGPFAEQWSMPFIGVGDHETAEDALERMLRDVLHIEPGPYEFVDTLYLLGHEGERFIVNAFSCVDWQGEPRYTSSIYDDAVWAPPGDPGSLALVPQVHEWMQEAFESERGSWGVEYDPATLRRALIDARGELIATYESVPGPERVEPLEDGQAPLDVLTHAADVEAYTLAEVRRSLEEPGHTWQPFNDAQWFDLLCLRPPEDEPVIRERLDLVRSETFEWLDEISAGTLGAYVNHPERGVIQVGECVDRIARTDRDRVARLRRMAQTAATRESMDTDPDFGQGNDHDATAAR